MSDKQAIRAGNAPPCPIRIDCPGEVAHEICRLAIDGLLALRRVGLGVGGLLLGTHDRHGVAISRSAPIPCSHSLGPAFRLTPDETELALRDHDGGAIVGCYVSKPGGFADPSDDDLAFFSRFCPEPWQVMMQVRPSTIEESRLVLYFRNAGDLGAALIRGHERALSETIQPEPEPATPTPALPELKRSVEPIAPRFAQTPPRNRTNFILLALAAIAVALALWLLFR